MTTQKFKYKVAYVDFRGRVSVEGDETLIMDGERMTASRPSASVADMACCDIFRRRMLSLPQTEDHNHDVCIDTGWRQRHQAVAL